MRHAAITSAVLAAILLGACASKQPEPIAPPPLVLGTYRQDTPREAACDGLIAQAMARDEQGGFKLVGMRNTNIHPEPGATQVPAAPYPTLAPLGSHPAGIGRAQLDGTYRSLFVDCETRQAYVSKRGGVVDVTYWFGPFGL